MRVLILTVLFTEEKALMQVIQMRLYVLKKTLMVHLSLTWILTKLKLLSILTFCKTLYLALSM